MKKIISILLISIILFGCSEKRVLIDETTQKNNILYYQGEKYTGIVFDIYKDGQIKYEIEYQSGKKNGLAERYFSDGSIAYKINYKDGRFHGRLELWDDKRECLLFLPMYEGLVVGETGEGVWGLNNKEVVNLHQKQDNIGNTAWLAYYLGPLPLDSVVLIDHFELQPDWVWQWNYNR